jgi:hypothetical protein
MDLIVQATLKKSVTRGGHAAARKARNITRGNAAGDSEGATLWDYGLKFVMKTSLYLRPEVF